MSPLRRQLLRLVRAPSTLSSVVVDRALAPRWLELLGVEVGPGCRFVGVPSVRLAPGARIRLGADLLVASRHDANPLGLPHPTMLAALAPGASIEIGDGCGLSGASIVARHSITIGRRVLVGAGAAIWDTDFHPLEAEARRIHPTDGARGRPVRVEDGAFIGARATILKGVTVGRGAVVGAGAVVVRDVPAGVIVAGNPARVIGRLGAHLEMQEEA